MRCSGGTAGHSVRPRKRPDSISGMCASVASTDSSGATPAYLRTSAAAHLPFAAATDDLQRALTSAGAAVVQSPPGTGKTTLAPGIVLGFVDANATTDEHHAALPRVVVTQPRRVAARSSAARINELSQTPIAGYTVRGESSVTSDTRIEFVTAGVLLRRLLNDPDLTGVAAVILDEVHERALDTDLALAMLAQLRELREDLLVVAMSATVDAPAFADVLAAPVVAVESPIHPLDIHYATSATTITARQRRARPGQPGSIEDIVASAVVEALAATETRTDATDTHPADLLAFVPTIRGTELVADLVTQRTGIPAVALHGQLSADEQAAIVRGTTHAGSAPTSTDSPARRVIVATNVAESSLTIPGVRVVVDSCLSRVNRRDSSRGMNVLVTELSSQASATQRAGRAGREGPGTVFRCITAEEYPKLPAFSAPEVATADLTGALLDCAVWGAPGGADLPLPDSFPAASAAAAQRQLELLGAVTASGEVTDLGRTLARLPMDPHLARGGLRASELVDPVTVAVVLFLLEQGRVPDNLPQAVARADHRHPTVRRFVRSLRDVANHSSAELTGTDAIAYTVACAFPHLIGRVTAGGDRVATVGGSAASFRSTPPASPDHWYAIADVAKANTGDGTGAVIRSALPLPFELAQRAVGTGVATTRVVTWDGSARKAKAREVTALGALELSSRPVQPTAEETREALREALHRVLTVASAGGQPSEQAMLGGDLIPLSQATLEFLRRVQCGHAGGVVGYPDLTKGLPDTVVSYVVDDLAAGRSPDVMQLLKGVLPWDQPVDQVAPATIELPNGRRAKVTYPELSAYTDPDNPPGPPVVATKLQNCFGLRESPIIAGRTVQFHLLSPAQRPVAVTDDLASFWDGSYQGVRKDMRGRYPKHDWPENP